MAVILFRHADWHIIQMRWLFLGAVTTVPTALNAIEEWEMDGVEEREEEREEEVDASDLFKTARIISILSKWRLIYDR